MGAPRGDQRTCVVCRDERAHNMVWGEKVDHSVGGGPAKTPIHTNRVSSLPINNCEYGKSPTLCLEGCGGSSFCAPGTTNSLCLKGRD
jgi:hypothetical protein